jgi:hypothetical protein
MTLGLRLGRGARRLRRDLLPRAGHLDSEQEQLVLVHPLAPFGFRIVRRRQVSFNRLRHQ